MKEEKLLLLLLLLLHFSTGQPGININTLGGNDTFSGVLVLLGENVRLEDLHGILRTEAAVNEIESGWQSGTTFYYKSG